MTEKYIKASECEKYFYEHLDDNGMIGAMNAIDEMPAADVQPVKHGEWLCVGHDDKSYWYRCSVCGFENHKNITKHDNYCRCCGAKMDAEPDEPWQSE